MDFDSESDSESNGSNRSRILEDAVLLSVAEMVPPEIQDTEETTAPPESTFDLTLPASHSYLGHNLEELRGRTVLDNGIYMNLPLVVKHSVILFPGQTLPMKVYGTQTINMLQTCIRKDHTFGVVCLAHDKMIRIGTTAEIYEYEDGGQYAQEFRLKAKGRQRFKMLNVTIQGYDTLSANVKVLPEVVLGPPFLDQRLDSLNRLRINAVTKEDLKKQERVETLDAVITSWPAWVYRQYDPSRLSLKIRQHLKFIERGGSNIPKDPTELSFWVAQNVILDNSERIDLLNYDCAISRLQKEIKYLIEDRSFVCVNCDGFITKQSNMFPMSTEGPQSAFCNAGGIIHETITMYHAEGLLLSRQPPSTEYTWFPGYAWTIASCRNCDTHMGWRFTAIEKDLKPKAFWGLTRTSLKNRSK